MLPFLVATAIITPIMTRHAGKMTIPVIAYIAILCLLGISTTFLFVPIDHFSIISKGTYLASVIITYAGAWIFAISDTLNGFGKFVKEFKYERIYTMSTYILGQFLLVVGYMMLSTNLIFSI
jgi:uncharacterized membrane protein YhhN